MQLSCVVTYDSTDVVVKVSRTLLDSCACTSLHDQPLWHQVLDCPLLARHGGISGTDLQKSVN